MITETELKNNGYHRCSIDGEPLYRKWILDSEDRKAFDLCFYMTDVTMTTDVVDLDLSNVSYEVKARMFVDDNKHFSWQNQMGGDGDTYFDLCLNLGSFLPEQIKDIEAFFAHAYSAMKCIPDQHNLAEISK